MAGYKNMTEGSPVRCLIRFTLPLLAGNLLQQTYNVADTMIVGKALGDDSLAAVGATGSITYLFYTLCIGLSIGSGVLIAQFFGSGRIERVRSAILNSTIITMAIALVMTLLSVALSYPVLSALGVPAKLISRSVTYMRIACSGTVCVAAYNWINAVMRALGDSKTPLIFLAVSTLLNVGLDLLFVMVFKMGVGGAALATILSQGLSAAGCILYFFINCKELSPVKGETRLEHDLMKKCLTMGLPIAAQNGLVSVSMVVLQSITNGFSETVMASYTVSMRIEQFVQQPFISMNAAVSTFTGQNIGAGKEDRAVDGLNSGLRISGVFAVMMLVVFGIFGRAITGCFVSGDEVISIASTSLIITGCFYVPLGVIHIVRGFLNGAGDTGYALVNGLTEVVCRILFANILTRIYFIGMWGIWITTAITWVATAAVSYIRYRSGKWKLKAVKDY